MTWLSTIVVTTVLCILIWGLRKGIATTLFLIGIGIFTTTVYFALTAVL